MVAVAVAFENDGGGFEQSCHVCKTSSELRHKWGCEEPTVDPVFFISPCVLCHGKDEQCKRCEGDNRVPMFRCPRQIATPHLTDIVQLVVLCEMGVLPDVGGWSDQATSFVQAYPIVSNEIARTRAKAQEQSIQRAKQRKRS